MDKQELLDKKSQLEKELSAVNRELYDYDIKALAEQYKDKFSCEFCRYNAVIGFSGDGWHNMCGAGNCTCCHGNCDKYKPDNAATLKIKQSRKQDGLLRAKNTNGYGRIDEEDNDALEELDARIFADEPTEYTMKMLDLLLENRK